MSANSAYQTKRELINNQIEMLQSGLKAMDDEQAANPEDWGFAGNAGHIWQKLAEVLEFVETAEDLTF